MNEFPNMGGVFYQEEPSNHPNRCKCLITTLKELLFFGCASFGGRFSTSSLEEEYPMSDFEEEQEVIVSAVISGVMEKQKHKPSILRHSFSWVYSPVITRELYVTQEEQDEREEFVSVKSCFSCCSSSVSGEAFYSVKTRKLSSRSSSLNEVEYLSKYWRRSVIEEFCHCEGWPFGLCRRAVLLPPLPKSPSESWLSRQIQTSINKPSTF